MKEAIKKEIKANQDKNVKTDNGEEPKIEIFNENNFDKVAEQGDSGKMNNYSENKNFIENIQGIEQKENNPTGKIETPPPPLSGSTGASNNTKNLENNQVIIEEKNESFKDLQKIIPKNIQNEEKNLNLSEVKKNIESSHKLNANDMEIENDTEKELESEHQNDNNMDIENDNDNDNNMDIMNENVNDIGNYNENINDIENDENENDIENVDLNANENHINDMESSQNQINFSEISTITTNQIGEEDLYFQIYGDNEIIDLNIPPDNLPVEEGDILNSSDFERIGQIEQNYNH